MSYFYAKMTIVMVHFILDKNIFTYEWDSLSYFPNTVIIFADDKK